MRFRSGGEGVIKALAPRESNHHEDVARIPTAPGARTSLWAPDLGQLFPAVPRRAGQAAIHLYQRE
jgi:hypothetical protein